MQRDDFLWVERYRPKTISECILPSDLEDIDYNLDSVDLTDLYIAYTPSELNDDMNSNYLIF